MTKVMPHIPPVQNFAGKCLLEGVVAEKEIGLFKCQYQLDIMGRDQRFVAMIDLRKFTCELLDQHQNVIATFETIGRPKWFALAWTINFLDSTGQRLFYIDHPFHSCFGNSPRYLYLGDNQPYPLHNTHQTDTEKFRDLVEDHVYAKLHDDGFVAYLKPEFEVHKAAILLAYCWMKSLIYSSSGA